MEYPQEIASSNDEIQVHIGEGSYIRLSKWSNKTEEALERLNQKVLSMRWYGVDDVMFISYARAQNGSWYTAQVHPNLAKTFIRCVRVNQLLNTSH